MPPSPPIITLTTDFGHTDSFVAQMKGVILSLVPDVLLVDITHQVPQHDIEAGARLISEAAPRFPDGTIHLVVVDPGVGTARKRIIVQVEVPCFIEYESRTAIFVGPDNGLFSLVAPEKQRRSVWEISRLDCLPPVERLSTFDARDVFAPVAALIASGRPLSAFGTQIESREKTKVLTGLGIQEPWVAEDGSMHGQIVYFDNFGNAVTNISYSPLAHQSFQVLLVKGSLLLSWADNYEAIPPGQTAVHVNGQGMLEISAYQGSAKELLGLAKGDRLKIARR